MDSFQPAEQCGLKASATLDRQKPGQPVPIFFGLGGSTPGKLFRRASRRRTREERNDLNVENPGCRLIRLFRLPGKGSSKCWNTQLTANRTVGRRFEPKMKIPSWYQNTSIGIKILSDSARKEQVIVIATTVAVPDCRAKE
jgi:hypothetical protein